MTLLWPLVIPIVGAALVLLLGANSVKAKAWSMVVGTAEILAIFNIIWRVYNSGPLQFGRYLRADALSALFLLNFAFISGLALIYSLGYLRHIGSERFSSPRWFYALLFFFLFTMVGVCLSANLGLLWIMMEATTLASALLVGFYNTEGAVEAGWKYLMVCTVGIAFALFGTIVLYLVAVKSGLPAEAALDWLALRDAASSLGKEGQLLKLAFVFVAVGYGTKAGLVPMHNWLPDAHAEAPSPISALLSAVLINCAMYTLLRYESLIARASGPAFTHNLLLVFGVTSVAVAGLLIVVQRDLKRLLAYSSVEHMGIVAIGVGLGGTWGLYGALLHTFNHAVGKALLFFTAGHVRQNLGTLRMDRITGLAENLPRTTGALVLGSLAIVGLPPFGLFVSEFAILSEAFGQARYFVAFVFLAILSVVFGGMLKHLMAMLFGAPGQKPTLADLAFPESLAIAVAAACLLLFGLHIPAGFNQLLRQAIAVLGS